MLPLITTCTLHIGFLCVHETEEQLARLRAADSSKTNPPKSPLLSDAVVALSPINKTAGIVTGVKGQNAIRHWEDAA